MTDIDPIELARLQRAFDRLPRFHAAVFSAVRHDGMTFSEIAECTWFTPLHVERILADALYRLDCDVCEQEHGVTISPIRRLIRERCRDLRLRIRVWRDRF